MVLMVFIGFLPLSILTAQKKEQEKKLLPQIEEQL